jgi:3-(3-hydroxy-phenyl)propionate hydroxylase
MSDSYDVAIVGLGPVGAMIALLLKEQGVRTLVLERDTDVQPFPRAAHFDDEAIRVYQAVGLETLSEEMGNPPRYQYYDKDWRPFLARLFPTGISDQSFKYDFMFYQPDVERAMRARLTEGPGAPDIRLGVSVTSLTQDSDGVTVAARDEAGVTTEYRASYVIGCDGASSIVRKSMRSSFTEIAPSRQWYIVDLELLGTAADDPGDDQWEYCDPDRIVTYIQLSGPYRRFEFDVKPGESEADLGTVERTWELIAPWFKPNEARIMRNDIYKFHSLVAEGWRDGRLLIAGDSAHVMAPKLGQGLCTGIRDAANLAWKLARVVAGTADDSILDSYEEERREPARQYVEISAYMVSQIISKASGEDDSTTEPSIEQIVSPRQMIGDDSIRGEDELVGQLSHQPTLADGTRMDDSVGYRFLLLAKTGVVDRLTAHDRAALLALGAIVLRADDPALASYLEEVGRDALLIRPDRYIAGSANGPSALGALLGRAAATYAAPLLDAVEA